MIIGIVLGISIGIVLTIAFNRLKPVKKVELSEEDKKKQIKLKKSFDELMQYDYDTALGGVRSE